MHKTHDEIEQKTAEIDYVKDKLEEMKAAAEAEIEKKTAECERLDGSQTARGAVDASLRYATCSRGCQPIEGGSEG